MTEPQVWTLALTATLVVYLIVDNQVLKRQVRMMSAGIKPLITAVGEDHARVAEDRESLRKRVVELEHALSTLRKAQADADAALGAPDRLTTRPPQPER